MTFDRTLTSFLLLTLLSACSSGPKVSSLASRAQPWKLVFSQEHALELEPCGCQFNPLGGIARTQRAIGRWRQETQAPLFYFSAGTAFRSVKHEAAHLPKAQFMARGFKMLGLDALAPSHNDLALGAAALTSLSIEAGAPFVLTNGKFRDKGASPLSPFLTLKSEDVSLLVLGVAQTGDTKAVEWTPPKVALQRFFASHPVDPQSFVVVLTNLSRQENEDLLKAFPQIHFFLGEKDDDGFNLVRQVGKNTLSANPYRMGKALATVDVFSTTPRTNLYSAEFAKAYTAAREAWRANIAELGDKLKGKVTASTRRGYQKELSALVTRLKASDAVPLERSSGSIEYTASTTSLDHTWDNPGGTTHALVEEYRNTVREVALKEE